MRLLQRRRGAYAWTGVLVLVMQMLSSATLAVGHPAPAGANSVSPPATDARSHDHCAATTDLAAAGQDAAAPGHCPHCADRACCLLGCVPVILDFSVFPPSRAAAVDAHLLALLSPACCAESRYRPPIHL